MHPSVRRVRTLLAVGVIAAAIALAGCSSSGSGGAAPTATASADPALAKLVTAAKKDGSVTLYTAQALGSVQPAADAFTATYGIPVNIVFLTTAPLLQRFSAESEAGATSADVIMATGLDAVATSTLVPKGWLEPISDAGIPALDSGHFPKAFLNTNTAAILYLPWIIAYNKDSVKKADIPTSFKDFGDPKFKGQILTTNPKVSIAFVQVWDRIQTKFGKSALQNIAKNNPRFFDTAPAAAEALAAGEGEISGPTTLSSIQPVIDAGAPVGFVTPQVTSGIEIDLAMVPAAKAPHPNAARLLANFLMSTKGNSALVPKGSPDIWVLNPKLDTSYIKGLLPDPGAASRTDEILAALGR